jgi:choline dehydrogenase-like flavoprotein
MLWAAKVLLAGGAHTVMAPVNGTTSCTSAEELHAQLKTRKLQDFTFYAAHPMSTCRMRTDPETSVIRPDGRAHRLEGLYSADGSIFPTSLGVNPSIAIMALTTVIGRGMVA